MPTYARLDHPCLCNRATAGAWPMCHAHPTRPVPGSSRRLWRPQATMAGGCCRYACCSKDAGPWRSLCD